MISVDHLQGCGGRAATGSASSPDISRSADRAAGRGFTTLTVLRQPLERTVSYLRHHRRRTPEDAELTLEEVYDDDLRFHGLIHNHMTKMLSLTPEEMNEGVLTRVEFTPERLERAKERLAGVDVVGLQ